MSRSKTPPARTQKTARGANVVVGGIIAGILLISLAFWMAGSSFGEGDGSALRAIVHDADGNAYELPLDEDDVLEVSTSSGSNTVVVEGGEVFVSHADCENLDCVHQGRISAAGQQIICLPHKMWIEVVEPGQTSGEMDVSAAASPKDAGSESFDSVSR